MKSIGEPIKLAVVGTRTYTDRGRVYFELDEICKIKKVVEIVSGIAWDDEKTKGPDSFARDYAKDRDIPYKGFPADWNDMSPPVLRKAGRWGYYNALAGPNRNTKIADYADGVLAFWDQISTGTYDVLKKFKALSKKRKTVKF